MLRGIKVGYILYDNYWWELRQSETGFRCENVCGGGFSLDEKTIDDIKANYKIDTTAKTLIELDWVGTDILDDSYETGWLSPAGMFFGCQYRSHSDQAEFVHKCQDCELESKGWAKLTYMFGNKNDPDVLWDWASPIRPTKAQVDYLANTRFKNSSGFMTAMHFIED